MRTVERPIETSGDMEALGARIAAALGDVRLIGISGPLGAGKTTLVRGLVRALGHHGAVKSPTFTLVEPYAFDTGHFYHFDLYRVTSPEELEFIGIRDYLQGDNVCAVEWPERAGALLPAPDLEVIIQPATRGRTVQLRAHTKEGEQLLGSLT